MRQTKTLYVEAGGQLVAVTVTLDAPDFLCATHGISSNLLLRAAADEQNMLVRSRHHSDRDVRIHARGLPAEVSSQAAPAERPTLRLVA